MSGGKAGAAGGVVLALGMGARFGDDCVRGGVRGASVIDDVAVGAGRGVRMASWGPEASGVRRGVGGLDDAARRGVGFDGAAVPGLRGAGLGDEVVGLRASEGHWSEVLLDAADVGVQLVSADMDVVPDAVVMPGEVRCPRLLDITASPDAWDELLGGLGVACAPLVIVGTASADGMALRVGPREVPLRELAEACADVGARCLMVGCGAARAEACVEATERSFRGNRLQPSLSATTRGFVARGMQQEPAPTVMAQLAVVEGETQLVLARPRE